MEKVKLEELSKEGKKKREAIFKKYYEKLLGRKVGNHFWAGTNIAKYPYETIREKIQNSKNAKIGFTKDEIEIIDDALEKACEYLPLLNERDDLEFMVWKAREAIFYSGRTQKGYRKMAEAIGCAKRKYDKSRDWSAIYVGYMILTGNPSGRKYEVKINGKMCEVPLSKRDAILYLTRKYKFNSKGSLVKGLRRRGVTNLPTHYDPYNSDLDD